VEKEKISLINCNNKLTDLIQQKDNNDSNNNFNNSNSVIAQKYIDQCQKLNKEKDDLYLELKKQ